MEKTTLKIVLAAAVISAGAGVAYAQDRGGERPTFETLDVDGSGEITSEDIAAYRANRFAEVDTDGNGTISEAEFMAAAAARAGERAAEMFARMDVDGDGELSQDALSGRIGGRGFSERMINRVDTDNSGGVSAEEFEAAQSRMAERRGGRDHGRGGKRGDR